MSETHHVTLNLIDSQVLERLRVFLETVYSTQSNQSSKVTTKNQIELEKVYSGAVELLKKYSVSIPAQIIRWLFGSQNDILLNDSRSNEVPSFSINSESILSSDSLASRFLEENYLSLSELVDFMSLMVADYSQAPISKVTLKQGDVAFKIKDVNLFYEKFFIATSRILASRPNPLQEPSTNHYDTINKVGSDDLVSQLERDYQGMDLLCFSEHALLLEEFESIQTRLGPLIILNDKLGHQIDMLSQTEAELEEETSNLEIHLKTILEQSDLKLDRDLLNLQLQTSATTKKVTEEAYRTIDSFKVHDVSEYSSELIKDQNATIEQCDTIFKNILASFPSRAKDFLDSKEPPEAKEIDELSSTCAWTLAELSGASNALSCKKEALCHLQMLRENHAYSQQYLDSSLKELEEEIHQLTKVKKSLLDDKNQQDAILQEKIRLSSYNEISSKGDLLLKASIVSEFLAICHEIEKLFNYMLSEYSRMLLSKLCGEVNVEFLEFKKKLVDDFTSSLKSISSEVKQRINWMSSLEQPISYSTILYTLLNELSSHESARSSMLDPPEESESLSSNLLSLINDLYTNIENFSALDLQEKKLLISGLTTQSRITSWITEYHSTFPNKFTSYPQEKTDLVQSLKVHISQIRQEVATLTNMDIHSKAHH